MAFIRGRHLLISSRLGGGRRLFEGGVYSREAFINFKQAGGGGVYSRVAFIRGRHLLISSRLEGAAFI